MAGKTGRSGRPKDPDAKSKAIMIRMSEEERADFDELVAWRNAQLASEKVRVKGPEVIRWLISLKRDEAGLNRAKRRAAKK